MKLAYLFTLTIPLAVFLSIFMPGYEWFTLLYAFGLIPFLELFLKQWSDNPVANNGRYYTYLLYIISFSHFVSLYFAFDKISHLPGSTLGLVFALGISCGVVGINVAHELGHRNTKWDQSLAVMLLSTSLYSHFFIEHNKGHHRHVSTPLDPASARFNESIYRFIPRSIWGSLVSAFKLDPKQFFMFKLLEASYLGGVFLVFGKDVFFFAVSIGVFGFLLLELVNYIEHYGLVRRLNPSGRYEKVLPIHSWNSSHPLSRLVLFELSRHSDHHANASREYQNLRHFDEAPQLPTGYPGMMLLALIPWLWFKVMNPRVEKLS